MINQQFFDYMALLEDKFAKKAQYNLFSVLRSESDEVRLHSRFLADLLNPEGSHQYGANFLTVLLERLGLTLSGQISVDIEYKDIDILIHSKSCAVIIENKIYAGDQPKQLARYYQLMRDEGYTDIKLVYLTLDGAPPSESSTDGLSEKLLAEHLVLLSYEDDIYKMIGRYIEVSATDAPLREALIQYKDIIVKLTSKIENKDYMDALKQLLKSDNNLASLPTLFNAYQEVLIEYQLDLWQRIGKGVRAEFGPLEKESIVEQPEREQYSWVKNYVENRRGSKYINIITKLNGYDDTYLIVEQDHRIYFGIYCENWKENSCYQDIQNLVKKILNTECWDSMPIAAFVQPDINFKHLSSDNLTYLSQQESRQEYADFIVNKLKEFVDALQCDK